jgi:hypothetical protein
MACPDSLPGQLSQAVRRTRGFSRRPPRVGTFMQPRQGAEVDWKGFREEG